MNRMLPLRLFGLVLIVLLTSLESATAEEAPTCGSGGGCTVCFADDDDSCYLWWCDDGGWGLHCDE